MNKLHEREYALKSAIRELTEQLQEHIETHGEYFKECSSCRQIMSMDNYYERTGGKLRTECKHCFKLRAREYDQTEAGRKSQRVRSENLRARPDFPEKQNARGRISDLVRMGKIPPAKELLCSRCGGPADHYHHHNGYTRRHREDVIPLCAQCHADEHFPN